MVDVIPNSCGYCNPGLQLHLFQHFIFVLTNKKDDIIMTYRYIDWFLARPFQVALCIQSATKISLLYVVTMKIVKLAILSPPPQELAPPSVYAACFLSSLEFCYFYLSEVYLTVFMLQGDWPNSQLLLHLHTWQWGRRNDQAVAEFYS